MKKIITFFLLCAALFPVTAQNFQTKQAQNFPAFHKQTNVLKSANEDTYPTGMYLGSAYIYNSLGGWSTATTARFGIEFPASVLAGYAGAQINQVILPVADQMNSAKLIIATSKDATTPIIEQAFQFTAGQWNTIVLTNPVTISGTESLFIGFEVSIPKGSYPICFDQDTPIGKSWIATANGGVYSNWSNVSANYGNLTFLCYITGESLPQYNVALDASVQKYVLKGNTAHLSGSITNLAAQSIHNFTLTYQIGNSAPQSEEITLSGQYPYIENKEIYSFSLDLSGFDTNGDYPFTLSVGKLNKSHDDEDVSDNTMQAELKVHDEWATRKSVMEEGTGTWCGYCPRGMVAMKNMKEDYADRFIGIAVHNNDPMAMESYITSLGFNSFPSAKMNRAVRFDADPVKAENLFLQQEWYTPLSFQIKGVTLNGSVYSVDTETKAIGADITKNYKIALVIIQNNVTGTASGYNQQNYYNKTYSGGQLGPMGGFEDLPHPVPAKQMVYNDVARVINNFSGQALLPSTLLAGVVNPATSTITKSMTIKEADSEVVALLIDATTGEIVNADIKPLSYTTGISLPQSDLGISIVSGNQAIRIEGEFDNAVVYDCLGRKVMTTTEHQMNDIHAGLYIVKVAKNGRYSTEKVIVR